MKNRRTSRHIPIFTLNKGVVLRDGVPFPLNDIVIRRQLGAGANGVAFEAEDLALGRPVALKLWTRQLADPRSLAADEIKKLAGLSHPLLATVHRFGVIDNWPFAIMELVPGVPLREHLTDQTLTQKDRCAIWSLFSKAMRFIYSTGTVHGDPHVGNVLVFEDKHDAYQGYVGSGISPRFPLGLKVLDTGTSSNRSQLTPTLRDWTGCSNRGAVDAR